MFFNPYLYSHVSPYHSQEQALAQEQARTRANAKQRARRYLYLPHEEDSGDDDDEYSYPYSRLSPRDRLYLEQLRSRSQSRAPPSQPTKSGSPSPPTARSRSRSRSSARSPPKATAETTVDDTQSGSNTSQFSDIHNEAATKIQTSYRINRSLRTIKDLEREFDEVKGALTFPTILDFQGSEGVTTITVPKPKFSSSPSSSTLDIATPKLAYTANNYAIHAHIEALNRLLMKLDGVESWGENRVRKSRKAVVRRIEAQVNEVEAYWKRAWVTYHERTSVTAMPAGNSEEDVIMKDETEAEVQTQHKHGQPTEVELAPEIDEDVRTIEEKEEESEVQMMVVDPNTEEATRSSTPTSTALIDESDYDNYIDAIPQLYHTDDSDSDSELDFEDAKEIIEPQHDADAPEPKTVIVAADSDSSPEIPSLSTGGDIQPERMEMVTESTKEIDVDSSLGEFVMVQ